MDNTFADFLRRVRAGDEAAAAELFHRYEPVIRREVRMRLTDPTLYRLFDSADICQSVLRSFFVRAAAGQYELQRPEDLLRLLVSMARNKVVNQARKLQRRPSDRRRLRAATVEALPLVADDPTPTRVIAGRDLLQSVLERLTADERRLADLRARGLTWPEVAVEAGGSSEARRKQLARALDRVLGQLGLEEDQDIFGEQ
jgi:RNA polymerase sigma-70 factor (ECF subfamily)